MSSRKFIDENDVPKRRSKISKWEETFLSIPIGKALVLDEIGGPIRNALVSLKAKGKFLNYTVTEKNNKTYVIHSASNGSN
jgi:hypothetical protein